MQQIPEVRAQVVVVVNDQNQRAFQRLVDQACSRGKSTGLGSTRHAPAAIA